MLVRIKLVTLSALLSLAIGVPTHAATLTPGAFEADVVINGGTEALSGVLGSYPAGNDWIVDITTDYDALTTFTVADPNPNPGPEGSLTYSLYECTPGNCAAGEIGAYSLVAGAGDLSGTLTTVLLATKEYFVRVGGTTNTRGYRVNVSAVPLPAAAWLFMSALAGFGLLSRKKASVSAA